MSRLILGVLAVTLGSTALAATAPRLETQWPGVHVVWYDDLQLKSVVAEFETFLAVVEVPHDDATGRALLGLLREKFPGKPVRFAFHTHHHDHSLGAVDSLTAAGVTLVTTAWNLGQVRKLASDPVSLDSRVLMLRDTFSLSDGMNTLTARVLRKDTYEIPTDEYILVEFPRAKALVSGCLFNKPLTYWEVVNTRKTSLDRFLRDTHLEVEWLVPTNSTRASGFEDICTRAMLTETLEKGLKPEEVADRLQARPVDELRRNLSALTAEFRAQTPRSYDLIVCGNYLKTRRKDYVRAAVLFEVASRLFPAEFDPLWYLGEAWSLAGDKARARAVWTRALERATREDDRARLQEALAKL